MLISVNWLRDFVDLPADLDPRELAERFTIVCAEVEGVEPISVGAEGLIAAGIVEVSDVPGAVGLRRVKLDVGGGRTVETVTAAATLKVGWSVIYAPPGAKVAALGEVGQAAVAGGISVGMILPGDALGVALAAEEAILLAPGSPEAEPGFQLPPEWFDDWVIEVDNKSITHRPDLWGHYGIAREMAAIFKTPLKPYPVTPAQELADLDLPEIPIEIDDPQMCPRYSGMVMRAVDPRPAPLWMQLRLGHVGLRPIDCLVDLTNYIMIELGQPMHAFDGDAVDRIEVGTVAPSTKFRTLDGADRTLPKDALMILSQRKPVALAGIMGGADTEIGPETKSLLLESANFNPAVIRRCAIAMGHRTDASARFEKSLDPGNTVLAIQRFVHLARGVWADLAFASRLSDCYPNPIQPVTVEVNPEYVCRVMGRSVSRQEMADILTKLEFTVEDAGDVLRVGVPSFRATKDISIQEDVIEEIARYVGYDNIEPTLPEVTVRSIEPNALHELEQRTLRLWSAGLGYNEIQGYLWYDADWCKQLGFDLGRCIELRNPISAGSHLLRQTLMPGLLAALERNRHHLSEVKLIELGGIFVPGDDEDRETRRIGVISAQRRKGVEDALLAELRGAIETWAWQAPERPTVFRRAAAAPGRPWQHEQKTGQVVIADVACGLVGALPLALRRTIDEHLAAWSVAWAEIELDALAKLGPVEAKLEDIPAYPQKDLDFTAVVPAARHYEDVQAAVARFEHPLLRRITYVTSYEGKSLGVGKRSLTFRAGIGAADRTLVDDDLSSFRTSFEQHLVACGLELRGSGGGA